MRYLHQEQRPENKSSGNCRRMTLRSVGRGNRSEGGDADDDRGRRDVLEQTNVNGL